MDGAKYFKGATNPSKFENWIKNIYRSAKALEVLAYHKMRLTTGMLVDDGSYW